MTWLSFKRVHRPGAPRTRTSIFLDNSGDWPEWGLISPKVLTTRQGVGG
jgi:hypothetical protein